ncbi:MAG: hypothetical protein IJ231_00055 [Clostridia bacterium]|nr:hypothetical protein [Clostridia bacterium]
MSEKIDLNAAQKKLAETLKGIGMDLWGTEDPEKWAEQAFDESAQAAPAAKQPPKAEKPAPIAEKKADLSNLWITADETIDWTEALISEWPRDGLTSPRLWAFYHRMAEKVLQGDLAAYVEVLTTLNPLGDLAEYVSGMVLRTPAAERLECEFECRPEEMEKDARGYLGALSVRAARDLLAVLPVEEVHVTGRMGQEQKLDVTFRRSQMLKRKMAFLNPADFVEECGGQMM